MNGAGSIFGLVSVVVAGVVVDEVVVMSVGGGGNNDEDTMGGGGNGNAEVDFETPPVAVVPMPALT